MKTLDAATENVGEVRGTERVPDPRVATVLARQLRWTEATDAAASIVRTVRIIATGERDAIVVTTDDMSETVTVNVVAIDTGKQMPFPIPSYPLLIGIVIK